MIEPIMIFGAFLTFFALLILLGRVDFKSFKIESKTE
jgi:hypothetical protein